MKDFFLFFGAALCSAYYLISCSSEREMRVDLLTFDISPDGKAMVFAAIHGYESSIYKMNIEDRSIEILFDGKDSTSLFAPKFNEKGDSIVFISSDFPQELNTAILIGDVNGKDRRSLLTDPSIKTEVVFSRKQNKLYYLQAAEYDGYSPLSRRAPHAFDIYSVDVNSRNGGKISDFASYSLSGIHEVNDSVLFFASHMKAYGGVFFYNMNSGKVERIIVNNDFVGSFGQKYAKPVFVDNETVLATMYYRLVSIDLVNKKETTIFKFEANQFGCIRYSKALNQIFVSIQGKNLIYILDRKGKVLDSIHISVISDIVTSNTVTQVRSQKYRTCVGVYRINPILAMAQVLAGGVVW